MSERVIERERERERERKGKRERRRAREGELGMESEGRKRGHVGVAEVGFTEPETD